MKRHCHHKMLSQKTCSSCKMSRDWDKSSLPVVLTGQATSSSSPPFPEEDPLQHRLHCQISDCVQCRCDSGYNMTTTRSSSPSSSTEWKSWHGCCGEYDHLLHRRAGAAGISANRPRYRHRSSSADYSTVSPCYKHPLSCSPFSINSPTTSSSSTDEICQCCAGHCEHCQYCCVCKLNTSSICNSDHHVTPTSPTVSSTHVCSCISKTLNLQPETSRNSTTVDTASMTNSTHHHHHSQQCSCSRWTFTLAAIFQSFMSRFSGRLRRPQRRRMLTGSSLYGWERMTSFLYTLITVATFCLSFLPISDACSSRSTPKPRPPSPTLRPNITIQTYTCPAEYDAHYCLNGATCFTVKIGESILYNCECAEGYMGQRCEFKDLDGSYLPSKQRAMLEQAGLTSGAAIIVVIVVIVCFYLYVRSRRKFENGQRLSRDVPDGMEYLGYESERRPFSGYYYSPTLIHSPQHPHHQSLHSPTNNMSSSYAHQPYPQQQKQHQPLPVCVGSSSLPSSEQEQPPPSTLISPPPIYPKTAEPQQDPCPSQ